MSAFFDSVMLLDWAGAGAPGGRRVVAIMLKRLILAAAP